MKYLVAAFGPDKLNDPARAEPVVQRMIQLDPGDTENYFMLAKIYDDAGVYENEEESCSRPRRSSRAIPPST